VSAPMKTLAQCAKIRPVSTVTETSSVTKPLVGNAEPWNAFLLSNPKFGLTIDELYADLKAEFVTADLEFEISFLLSGDVVLRALATGSWTQKVDQSLEKIKGGMGKRVSGLKLADRTVLCRVDGSGNVLRREDEGTADSGGWSQVAKGASAMRRVQEMGVGAKSAFTVLGAKKERKEKRVVEDAVEDWEKEVEGWGDV
jgi:transcriptional repressor NF-X1